MVKTLVSAALCAAFALLISAAVLADEPTFYIGSDISAAAGETVTVPIHVSNNPGFTGVTLELAYDSDALELTGASAVYDFLPLDSFEIDADSNIQWFSLFNGSADFRADAPILNVTFRVKDSAALGASALTLSIPAEPDGSPVNASLEMLEAVTESGSISVSASANPPAPSASESTAAETENTPAAQNPVSAASSSPAPEAQDTAAADTGTSAVSVSAPAAATPASFTLPDNPQNAVITLSQEFGDVPRTSTFDVMLPAAGMAFCLFIIIAACVPLFIKRRKHR